VKSLHLRLRPEGAARHPLHDALCESPDLDREYVLWGRVADGVETLLTYVEGDADDYAAAVEAVPQVIEADVTPDGDDGAFVYLRARLREADRRLGDALDQETVVWIPPIVERGDGTVDCSLVGHPADLQAVVDDLPEGVAVEDVRVSDHATGFERVLTDRQREALTAAWEAGYFDQPRTADLGEVADRLGIGRGAASELLRRGERALVRSAVGRPTPGWAGDP
jgi:predicted DNA binding protein